MAVPARSGLRTVSRTRGAGPGNPYTRAEMGSVTSDDIASVAEGRDLELGDSVRRSGIEQMYDNLLAGDHGERKVMADAAGNCVEVVSDTQPAKGADVHSTWK